MELEPGTTLLHYRIDKKIGEGGMGVVWKAHDTTLDRDVAIKVLPQTLAADGDRLVRFEREAKILAALNHPNISAVYGFHEDRDLHFLVMEYVPGEDLGETIARGALSLEPALRLALQMIDALEAAHSQGIVHRDLKPANVRITPEGQVKVLDLGLAKAFESEADRSNVSNSPSPTMTSTAPNRPAATRRTSARMSGPSARRCSRCSRESGHSTARRFPTRWRRSSNSSLTGHGSRRTPTRRSSG
jgi:serine/threonine-protein kinase